ATRQRIHAALAATIQDQQDRQLWHRAAATIGPDDALAGEYERMAERALRRGAVAMAIEILENAARLAARQKPQATDFCGLPNLPPIGANQRCWNVCGNVSKSTKPTS